MAHLKKNEHTTRSIRRKRSNKRNNSRKAKARKTKKRRTIIRKRSKNRKKKRPNSQKGGLVSSLLNPSRFIPHVVNNSYNSLVGNSLDPNFLPWSGHY